MIDIFAKLNIGKGLLEQLKYFIELKKSYMIGSVPSVMPFLYMDLLKDCNLKCKHCGYASDYPEEEAQLTKKELFDIIKESKKLYTEIISFGGGEPFLHKDIFDLIECAQSTGAAVHINSNGTLITEEKAAKLNKFKHITIVLSLDHPELHANDKIRGKGVYEKVITAAKNIQKHAPNVNLGLNCVVGAYNYNRLTEMIQLGYDLGIKSVKFSPAHENLNHNWKSEKLSADYALQKKHCKELELEIKKFISLSKQLGIKTNSEDYLLGIPEYIKGHAEIKCYAGYVYGNIDPYGNMFPCYDHKNSLNVRQMGLVNAWKSDEMQEMRKKVKTCKHKCWNTGNAEPSIRMDIFSILRNPLQIINDYKFYLK